MQYTSNLLKHSSVMEFGLSRQTCRCDDDGAGTMLQKRNTKNGILNLGISFT